MIARTTTVALRFKSATLRAKIDPADVDKMLRDVDSIAASARDRGGAMTWVLRVSFRRAMLS